MDITHFVTLQNSLTPHANGAESAQIGDGANSDGFAFLLEGFLNTTDTPDLGMDPHANAKAQPPAILTTALPAQGLTEIITDDFNTPASLTLSLQGLNEQSVTEPVAIGDILLLDGADIAAGDSLLTTLVQKINTLKETTDAKGVLFNLTPQQITQLEAEIAAKTSSDTQQLDGLQFILISLIEPEQPDAAFIHALPFAQNTAAGVETSALNTLVQKQQLQGNSYDELLNIQTSTDKFRALLKQAAVSRGQEQTPQTIGQTAAQGGQASQGGEQAGKIAMPSLPSGALGMMGAGDDALLAGFQWDETMFQSYGLLPQNGGNTANLASLTHISTQSSAATQAHPSTALVAASFTKMQGSGDLKSLRVQLDPPELGRVEVRMEFGKDKSVKATVISEKPEAHFMLQRDAQVLERALQEMGLDNDGSSLSFELADDGQNFGQNGGHDGSRNQAARMACRS